MLRSPASKLTVGSRNHSYAPEIRQSGFSINKIKLLASGSAAICALILAGVPHWAYAQVGAPSVNIRHSPIDMPGSARGPMVAKNQSQLQALDLASHDIHMSAPTIPIQNSISVSTPVPAVDRPQAFISNAGNNVRATAVYDDRKINFTAGANEDLVTVFAPESIINWTTNVSGAAGTQVDFLPAGGRLRFSGDGSDYTVLNRVFTPGFDSAVRIDGTVTSDINGARGGNIWFYSPGGIIAGTTSIFDVGSLVLTTNDIDTTDGLFGDRGEIRFRGADIGPGYAIPAVVIQNGAQINAVNNGSYLAVVASRVEQAGSVDVNGSVAYVASEQADLTIDKGLFDITIPVGSGTADANGIVHSGTTTGSASTNERTDAQAIYMVAVPKNSALTMLVGGNIGYQPAVSANIENGNVVLSSGYNVTVDNRQEPIPDIADNPVQAHSGNIEFRAGGFTSAVTAALSGDLATNSAGTLDFSDDLSLTSIADFAITFDGLDQFSVGGNTSIRTDGEFSISRDVDSLGILNPPQIVDGMDIVSPGNIVINAVRIDVGDLTAGGFIDLDSQTDINFGVGLAQTGFTINAATDLTFAEANTQSGNISIFADNIAGGSIRGGLDGSDNGNDFILVGAAGNVALTGTVGSLDRTTITAGGDLNIATIQNTQSVTLTATGNAIVDTLNTATEGAIINGASVILNNGDIAANLTLNATTIDGVGNDTVTIGGLADFNATGDITFETFTAGTGFDIDSTTGDVNFTTVNTRSGNITIDTLDGDITGAIIRGGLDGSDGGNDFILLNASRDITLTDTVGSLDNTTITAGRNLDIATVQNTDSVFLNASGAVVVDTLNTAFGSVTISGPSVILNSGDIAAGLTLNATAIDGVGNDTVTIGGFADFNATGNINIESFNAGTGIDIDTIGDVTFVEANTQSGNINIDANNITGGSVRGGLDGSDGGNDFIILNAAGNVALTGTVGSLDGTTITSGGDLDISTIQNTDNVILTAGGVAVVDTLNSTAAGAIVNGTSVKLNNGDIATNLTLNATAGDVAGNGVISLGGFANFDATGDIAFGAITAG
ncbi:MAG: hypothetical protein ABJO01_01235, partial [Parasphingorhabdus sp.]